MAAGRSTGRERHDKILIALHDVSAGTTKVCSYEDVVVKAWQLFPEEFGLRGYTDRYPDASDLHKPLYGPLKEGGFVRSGGRTKSFGLTERGLEHVERLRRPAETEANGGSTRLQRSQVTALKRLTDRSATALVLSGKTDELLDTDLYDFYGVTVRTGHKDFAGAVNSVDSAIDAALAANDPSVDPVQVKAIAMTRDALKTKHADLLAAHTAAAVRARA